MEDGITGNEEVRVPMALRDDDPRHFFTGTEANSRLRLVAECIHRTVDALLRRLRTGRYGSLNPSEFQYALTAREVVDSRRARI